MNTKKLKQLVLDLAIHGKLVPQDPNDEPASELLKRIQADVETRGRASNKSKGKKSAVSSVDLDEVPFEVPEGWCWCKISEIASFIGGFAYKSPDFIVDSPYQVLRISNVKNDFLKLSASPVYISKELAEDTNRYRCQEYDILFTMTGTKHKRDYFFTTLVKKENENCFINQRVGAFRFVFREISKFLIYVLKNKYILDQVFEKETGTANQGNIGSENVMQCLIPLPPLAEQHRIVGAIEKWFAVIDQLEKNEADLKKSIEQTKKKVLDLAIRGKLVAQNPEDEPAGELLKRIKEEKAKTTKGKKAIADVEIDEVPFELPKGWEWCRICDIFNITLGQSPDGDSVSCDSNGIEFHQGKLAFTDKIISKSGVFTSKPSKMACKDSLLLCMRAPVGDVNITDRDICIGRGLSALKPYASMPLSYWFYALQSVKVSLNAQATGSTFVAITGEILNNQLIPLPPLAEQKRIVEKIEEVFEYLDSILYAGV